MIKVKIPSYLSEENNSSSNDDNKNNLINTNSDGNSNNSSSNDTVDGNSMPASIILTHFCETHGPSVVFTTQTERIIVPPSTIPTTSSLLDDENDNNSSSNNINNNNSNNINNSSIINNINNNYSSSINNSIDISVLKINSNSNSIPKENGVEKPFSEVNYETDDEDNSNSNSINSSNSNNINSSFKINYINNNNSSNNSPITLPKLFENENEEFKTFSVTIATSSNTNTNNSDNNSESATNSNSTSSTTTNTVTKQCPTCSSVQQGQALVSKDPINRNVFYVSTHQTSNQSYSVIRNACVRSLSCEAVQGREGPVLISSNDGHWLSYMFKINDSRARGSARWYGFLILLKEGSCLLSYYSWLIGCFKSLAEEIKRKTNVVFEREKSQQSHNSSMISNIYRRGTRSIPLKQLTELTEDSGFFTRLHKSFCSILSNCQIKYHLLKGSQMILPEQEESIQFLKNNINNSYSGSSISGKINSPSLNGNGNAGGIVGGFGLNLNVLNETNILLLENIFPKREELITSLGQVQRNMGEDAFSILIYNVIIGNQVIIRGSSQDLVASMVDTIKDLLPTECASICSYSETFKEQWECNILGLSTTAVIPIHIDKETTTIIDIEYYDKSKEPEDIDHPYRSTIEITCIGPKYPSTLGLAIESIYKQYCSTSLENIQLKSIKEEWINKSKSFYSIKTMIENEKDKRLFSFLNIINCQFEKDMEILMFWCTPLRKWFMDNKIR